MPSLRKRSYSQMLAPYAYRGARYVGKRLGNYAYKKMVGASKRAGVVGQAGVFTGRVKRARKQLISKYLKYGCDLQYQSGQVSSSANNVVIGHGPAARQMVVALAGALVKRIFKEVGIGIDSWTQVIGDSATLVMTIAYRSGPDGAVLSGTVAGLPTTYWALVTALADRIQNMPGDGILVNLYMRNENANGDYRALLYLDKAIVEMEGSSTLVIQNRTTPVAADNSTDDVRANPIIFKKMECKGNALVCSDDTVSSTGFAAAPVTGYIANGAPTAKGLDSIDNFNNVRRAINGSINPGSVKKDMLKWYFKGSADKFMRGMEAYVEASTAAAINPGRVMHGKSHVFEFERLCDTRQSEPNLTVGFEIVGGVKCVVYVNQGQTTPRRMIDLASTF